MFLLFYAGVPKIRNRWFGFYGHISCSKLFDQCLIRLQAVWKKALCHTNTILHLAWGNVTEILNFWKFHKALKGLVVKQEKSVFVKVIAWLALEWMAVAIAWSVCSLCFAFCIVYMVLISCYFLNDSQTHRAVQMAIWMLPMRILQHAFTPVLLTFFLSMNLLLHEKLLSQTLRGMQMKGVLNILEVFSI